MIDAAENLKSRAATLSVATNIALCALKLGGAAITGSVALLSEGLHSSADVAASLMAYFSVRAAAVPADEGHPYGHAKIESLGGLAESVLLGVLALVVEAESIRHLMSRAVILNAELGIFLLGVSAVASLLVGRYVTRVGKQSRSPALTVNGAHLASDFWSSIGVIGALAVFKLTGWYWIDGVIGIAVGLWLMRLAFGLGADAVQQLIDRRLPDEEVSQVRSLIAEQEGVISFHRLRTRMSGNVRYLDFHVVVPNDWSVVDAHDAADGLERRIKAALAPCVVIVHVDPYDERKAARPPASIEPRGPEKVDL